MGKYCKLKKMNKKLKYKKIKKLLLILIEILFSIVLFSCSEKNTNNILDNNKLQLNELEKENEIDKFNKANDNDINDNSKNIIKEFRNPSVVKDPKMPSGLKTTWQCVYFGSFPQIEILKNGDELPIDDYALNDDVIYDDELYDKIINSSNNIETLRYDIEYDTYEYIFSDGCVLHSDTGRYNEKKGIIEFSNRELQDIINIEDDNIIINIEDDKEDLQFITVENKKYLLIKEKNKDPNIEYYDEEDSENNNLKKENKKQYYKKAEREYLFKYSPIKWRIVDVDGSILTLISDKLLDSVPADGDGTYTWENSEIRSYLNAYDITNFLNANDITNYCGSYKRRGFYDVAFNKKEKEAILKTKIKNDPNEYYGTSSGEDTEDFVYIPSNEEVFSSDTAAEDGFYEGSGVDDAAKRFRSTIYAKYRGAWWSPVEEYKGNSFWYTRTNGYSDQSISYICDFGYIYSRGMKCDTIGAGVLPMIRVNARKIDLYDAGFVSSDEINKDTYKFKNIDEEETNVGETSETKKENENVKKNYDIVEFGTYPQREIVTTDMTKDKMFYLKEGEYILDNELYKKLDEKVTKVGGEIEIDGEKYYAARNSKSYLSNPGSKYIYDKYLYDSVRKKILGEEYHYFKVDPIKWRVLENKDGKITLMSDKVIDRAKFYLSNGECTWMESDILEWLNLEDKLHTPFYKKAFTEEEQEKIITKTFDNENMKNNYYFGTSCIADENNKNIYEGDIKVYIISEEDLFYGEKASVYGFDKSDGVADVNRRFNTTAYARFQGVWFSKKDDENYGNAFYMTRTNGYDKQNVVYVGEKGAIYNRGIDVTTDDIGFLPMIDIKD